MVAWIEVGNGLVAATQLIRTLPSSLPSIVPWLPVLIAFLRVAMVMLVVDSVDGERRLETMFEITS